MNGKEKIILPYSKRLTIPAAILCAVSFVMLVIAIAVKIPLLTLAAISFLIASASLMIQNKRICLDGKRIRVKHFLGIIKEQSFEPVECGIFLSRPSPLQRPTYIDKRVIHREILPDEKKFIYISEYVLSKQDREGSQYAFGEPVLIIEYTDALYASLTKVFEFNCEPSSPASKKAVDK